MSQLTGAHHTGKRRCSRCSSTRASQVGFVRRPVPLARRQRETSPGQDGGEVWGDLRLPARHVEAAELLQVEGIIES